MMTKFSSIVRWSFAVVFSAGLAGPLAVAVELIETPSVEQWRARYEGGTEGVERGTRLKIIVNRQNIVCETARRRHSETFTIPASKVTKVSQEVGFRSLPENCLETMACRQPSDRVQASTGPRGCVLPAS